MDPQRLAIAGVVATVIVVSLLSGPLVAGVDLSPTPSDDGHPPQTGNATVEVLSTPDTVRLEKGSFGSESPYTLVVPDATIRISNVTGGPLLIYKLRIPELGYSRGTTYFLDGSSAGTRSVGLDKTTVNKDLWKDQYRGELLLLLRGDGPEQILYRDNVTVEVVR
jgi:hypothetical protein